MGSWGSWASTVSSCHNWATGSLPWSGLDAKTQEEKYRSPRWLDADALDKTVSVCRAVLIWGPAVGALQLEQLQISSFLVKEDSREKGINSSGWTMRRCHMCQNMCQIHQPKVVTSEVPKSGVVVGVGGHPPAFKDYLLRARSLEFKAAWWKLPMIFCIRLLFASEWMIWMFIVHSMETGWQL